MDGRNLLVCAPSFPVFENPVVTELCGFATPGDERKVSATMTFGSGNVELSIESTGLSVDPDFLAYAPFMDACVRASRRTCGEASFSPEQCVRASVGISECAAARAGEVAGAFDCEAVCGAECADSCGVLESLLG